MKKIVAVLLFMCLCSHMVRAAGSVWNTNDGVILSGKSNNNRIALTFDDGPHPYKTDQILDLLRKYHIRATFFVIGENVAAYPNAVLREIAEGHEVGNHTYHHMSLYKCKKDVVESEIAMAEKILVEKTGYAPHVFRPPEGAYTCDIVDVANRMQYDVILWTVDTRDWAKTPTAEIVANVEKNVRGGSIILFHDFTGNGAHTLESLEILIPKLMEMGYEFVTVSELISE